MNKKEHEILQRKPIIIYKYKYEINESCLNCKHFLWTWDNSPFCGFGRNIYGLCFKNESRRNEIVDYD